MTDEIFEENPRYAPDGYWPIGTPCPRRAVDGRAGIELVKEKVVQNFGKVPPHALSNILKNPAFKNCRTIQNADGTTETVDEARADVIDAISVLDEGVEF